MKTVPERFTDEAIITRMQPLLNGPYLSELTSDSELLEFLKEFRDELLREVEAQ